MSWQRKFISGWPAVCFAHEMIATLSFSDFCQSLALSIWCSSCLGRCRGWRSQAVSISGACHAGTPHKVLMTALSAKWSFLKVGAEGTPISGCTDLGLQMQRLQL